MKDEWAKQLDKFSKLEKNWDTHNGNAISEKSVKTARLILNWLEADLEGIVTNIMPCSSGGIQLEWHIKGKDLEVHITGAKVELFWTQEIEGIADLEPWIKRLRKNETQPLSAR